MALWAAAVAAGLGYLSSREQKKAAEQGSHWNSEPWGPAQGYLKDILTRGSFLSNLPMPEFYGRPPQLRGAGVTDQTRQIADLLFNMGTGESPFLKHAENFTGDLFGGLGYNPFMERLAGEEGKVKNPGQEEFIKRGLDGNLLDTGYLDQFIQGGLGDFASFAGLGSLGGGSVSRPDIEPNDWLRALLDGEFLEEGNPHNAALIDSIRREGLETYEDSIVPQIDSRFVRSGRYGSGSAREAHVRANEEANEAIGGQIAQVQSDTYNQERDRMTQGLGMLVGQENAAMSANAATSAASIGARASSANAARGQLLEAILGDQSGQLGSLGLLSNALSDYSGDRRFEIDSLGRMAEQLSDDRLRGLGLIPGLEEARYIGPTAALQGQQPLNDARRFNAGIHNQNAMNQYGYDVSKWEYQTEYPWEQLNRFASLAIPIAGAGGSGSQFSPYTGQSPWLSALQWGFGGYGLGQQYGGGGGGNSGLTGNNSINYNSPFYQSMFNGMWG